MNSVFTFRSSIFFTVMNFKTMFSTLVFQVFVVVFAMVIILA